MRRTKDQAKVSAYFLISTLAFPASSFSPLFTIHYSHSHHSLFRVIGVHLRPSAVPFFAVLCVLGGEFRFLHPCSCRPLCSPCLRGEPLPFFPPFAGLDHVGRKVLNRALPPDLEHSPGWFWQSSAGGGAACDAAPSMGYCASRTPVGGTAQSRRNPRSSHRHHQSGEEITAGARNSTAVS